MDAATPITPTPAASTTFSHYTTAHSAHPHPTATTLWACIPPKYWKEAISQGSNVGQYR